MYIGYVFQLKDVLVSTKIIAYCNKLNNCNRVFLSLIKSFTARINKGLQGSKMQYILGFCGNL